MVIVSACLAGLSCRYNGSACPHSKVVELVAQGKAIPICPEQMGGLPTPRPPVEIKGGTGAEVLEGRAWVSGEDGQGKSAEFIKGAEETLRVAAMVGAKKAILKARSPSCGCGSIYDGTFSGKLKEGNGVTAELLMRNGIEVITEEDL